MTEGTNGAMGDTASNQQPNASSSVGEDHDDDGPKRSYGMEDMISEEITKTFLSLESSKSSKSDGKVADKTKEDSTTATEASGVQEEAAETTDMRESDFYKGLLKTVRWQRDNYLVGRDFADEAQERREKPKHDILSINPDLAGPLSTLYHPIPFDATALGNIQLAKLGSWFIPSLTVHNSLLPLVVALPNGALYEPILRATVNLIPLSQPNLEYVMKAQIISVLKDKSFREIIKSSTQGYISTYRDAPQSR